MQENSVQFNTFGVRYKQGVTLTTFNDTLKQFAAFESVFFAKLCLHFGLLVYSFKYTEMW